MSMIISYRYKFLFIHIPKTAGTSVTKHFVPYARFVDRLVYGYWFTRKIAGMMNRFLGWQDIGYMPYTGFLKHGTALDAKNKLPEEVFKSLFKFAFVRNPWDWKVSLYLYIQWNPKHKFYEITSSMSFSDFIKWNISQNPKRQIDFVSDESGKIITNFVGKFEDLYEDFETIKSKLSLPNLGTTLPQTNISKNREFKDYRKYYNDETCSLVGEYFQDDIETFGYKFE